MLAAPRTAVENIIPAADDSHGVYILDNARFRRQDAVFWLAARQNDWYPGKENSPCMGWNTL